MSQTIFMGKHGRDGNVITSAGIERFTTQEIIDAMLVKAPLADDEIVIAVTIGDSGLVLHKGFKEEAVA